MEKEFNDTGVCVPSRHYMVNTSDKIKSIIQLIEKGKYFTISRPRQFGKTTTLFLIMKKLFKTDEYLPVRISFEGLTTENYANEKKFLAGFCNLLKRFFRSQKLHELLDYTEKQGNMENFDQLNSFITNLCSISTRHIVLMIDEVDKSSNNQLFLDFLALLRTKFLDSMEGQDTSFHSIIMAGVHDIKTLKAKIRPDDERKYNSPWNIASDFNVDLSFSSHEIETMLNDYSHEKNINPDIRAIAQKLYYYTSGYPWLVSKLCKLIDENIITQRKNKNWLAADVEAGFRMIADKAYSATLFDSLIKNLENNNDLYELVFQIIINGRSLDFSIDDPVINLGHLYGILVNSERGRCQIHNRIFEQRIYAYMMSKVQRTKSGNVNEYGSPEFYNVSGLDIRLVLQRFQTFMKEHYSQKDAKFLEREGRLLFLSYLRPIINGRGFDFKEPNVSDERRMDIVITYENQRYVIELKIWHGPKYHQKGLKQLSAYLDTYQLKEGYLLIYDFNKNKDYKQEQIIFEDKEIFAVWV
ncbi:p-loop domain-containing protein [Desulfonema limicola]|uniref:P-loop domain-containing protein n=1 Tax=Desulfonema limicola TaxID=45656 RepID=A0A975GIS8_9BACT|nr:AAA-like domain-containing protein [Desulfonema limicola]QTA82679.1 p-loop domain-containing protein [Desulfonema limicola]